MKASIKFLATIAMLTIPFTALGAEKMSTMSASVKETYADIQKTFGFVPDFMKLVPAAAIKGAWMEVKAIHMNPQTALTGKEKSLVGLAVGAQIPCHYCVYIDTQFSKANGASEEEMKEAVAIAASTRHWSTWLNGTAVNEDSFKKETDQILKFAKNQMDKAAKGEKMTMTEIDVMDAESAYKDIHQTFGFVPGFFKSFPEHAVAGAWTWMKSLQMSPNTSLTSKQKELIGLAVSAQIPCHYCTYFHTEAAKFNGATDQEIKEAVAVAATSREWSTFFNGGNLNEKKFHMDVDRMMKAGQPKMASSKEMKRKKTK